MSGARGEGEKRDPGLSSGVNDICAGKNSDSRGCYPKNAIVTPHCSFSPLFPANPQRRMT